MSEIEELPPFDQMHMASDSEGVFTLEVLSKKCGDVTVTLSPQVAIALYEIVVNTLSLQLELDKVPAQHQPDLTLDMTRNVVKGLAFFEALGEKERASRQLEGAFGATRAKGEKN